MRVIFAAFIMFQASFTANADQFLGSALHIMCDEEAGFFELQTKQAPNISHYPDMYTINTLEQTPFICEFNRHKIRISGKNRVDGKGPCGAVHGKFAQVTINDMPLTAPLTSTKPYTSARQIRKNGTFDITGCFDRSISMTVREGEGWFLTEVCHSEDDRSDDHGRTTGECIQEFHTKDSPYED
ncbi:MAG: hypothetical protein QNI84_06545 [Henriciella sp.]|nr:hypothetical protein [Henriciella sp.]